MSCRIKWSIVFGWIPINELNDSVWSIFNARFGIFIETIWISMKMSMIFKNLKRQNLFWTFFKESCDRYTTSVLPTSFIAWKSTKYTIMYTINERCNCNCWQLHVWLVWNDGLVVIKSIISLDEHNDVFLAENNNLISLLKQLNHSKLQFERNAILILIELRLFSLLFMECTQLSICPLPLTLSVHNLHYSTIE